MSKATKIGELSIIKIKLKHLQNDFELTREEYDTASRRYLEIVLELKQKNDQLLDLQKNLENLVAKRTEELEKTQRILQQKSEELQAIMDCSPTMIFYKDAGQRFVRVNKAFAEFAGRPIKQIIGKTNDDVFEDTNSGIHDNDDIVISTGEPILHRTVNYTTPRGERELLVNKMPYRDDSGEIVGIIGFALDITEHRQLEYEKNKVNKLESLGVLAGGIAHDFNDIIAAILGNISRSQTMVGREDEVFRMLKNAENACLKAKDLTRQLLTFARGGTPVKETTALSEMIKEIIWFALSGSNVRASFAIAEDLVSVNVDKDQISQVINNLALNAVQAMPEGGVINVSADNIVLKKNNPYSLDPGHYIRIGIADQGHGIEPENLPRIFDPFFTTRESSSGMGSTTAWSIVKHHGGHIAVESKPGAGSLFEIYLPSSTNPAEIGQGEPRDAVPSNLRILVMDDDRIACDIAGHILRHLGHRAEFAVDGEEAVKVFSAARENGSPFDMVILDLTTQGTMGGKQAVVEIRKVDPAVKALVASGYSNDPVLADCRHYGFDGIVAKPFNVDGLRQSMALVYISR